MADTHALGACAHKRESSSLSLATKRLDYEQQLQPYLQ